MRIGLITTLGTNIGDDFIREGICRVMRDVFPSQPIEFVPVNKHRPMTVYPESHPCRMAESFPRGKKHAYILFGATFGKAGRTLFDDCDLIVQCGAPVLWPDCHKAEWAVPLWHQVVGRLHERIPVLNLAAGSCYPWERQPATIAELHDAAYVRAILGYCRATTSRDALAQRLFSSLGGQTPHIPCSALLAAPRDGARGEPDNLVLINYMAGGGHYGWGQNIDETAWRTIVRRFIDRVRKRRRIAFLCHDRKEYEAAGRLDPSLERFFPQTSDDYFRVASKASAALCNRMHASVGLAGMGIPSVTVGTDTRLLMVETLKLPCHYVKDVTAESAEEELEDLIRHRAEQKERLLALRSATFRAYVDVVSGAARRLPEAP